MNIEELYAFAGVKEGCTNEEFMEALYNKIDTFKPETEDDQELLRKVQESLGIIEKIKESNKESVRRLEEENAFNKHTEEVINIVNNHEEVKTGMPDEEAKEMIDFVNKKM